MSSTQTWTTVGPELSQKTDNQLSCVLSICGIHCDNKNHFKKQYVVFDKIEGAGGKRPSVQWIRSSCKPLRPGLSVNRYFSCPVHYSNLLQITRAQPKAICLASCGQHLVFFKIQLKCWKHNKTTVIHLMLMLIS